MNDAKQMGVQVLPGRRTLLGIPESVRAVITPFNVIAGALALTALVLIVVRYALGLGAVTAASQDLPWGLLLTWGLFTGIPLGAPGFVLTSAVFIFGLKQFQPVVKNAVLVGFLFYLFAAIFLLVDLGRPWRLPYPILGNYGTASVLLEVAWCVALYLSCQFLELTPSLFAWRGWQMLRKYALKITIALTVLGVLLSTLHQSALGGLLLLTPTKLHPLWYSPYLPPLFFISAIAAGISLVIIVPFLTRHFMKDRASAEYLNSLDGITLGLGKAGAFVLFTYFALKVIALAHGNNWDLLASGWGAWYLVEVVGFVLIPAVLLIEASRTQKVGLVRFGAVLTLLGVILNRFNVSLIALNWQLPERELFAWKEVLIVVGVVAIQVMAYRWIVNHLPILDSKE